MTVAAWYTSAAVAAGNMTPRPLAPDRHAGRS